MGILPCTSHDTSIIAQEDLPGGFGGEFFKSADGTVSYRHDSENRIWFVNSCKESFWESVAALYEYLNTVVTKTIESDQLDVVDQFEFELNRIEAIRGAEDSYWAVIVEQARDGLL